jgi:hypothetical protein
MALTRNQTPTLKKPSTAMVTPAGGWRACASLACPHNRPGAAARVHDAAGSLCGVTVNLSVPTPAG